MLMFGPQSNISLLSGLKSELTCSALMPPHPLFEEVLDMFTLFFSSKLCLKKSLYKVKTFSILLKLIG